MKPALVYRIASVLLILFALGHTFGFLSFKPPTAEGLAVRDAMSQVHFQVRGSDFTYAGFYVGFGLFVTLYLLFSAFLAWHLGALATRQPHAVGSLGWVLFGVQVASLALSLAYFSVVPAMSSGVVAACLGWGAWQVHTSNRRQAGAPGFNPAWAARE